MVDGGLHVGTSKVIDDFLVNNPNTSQCKIFLAELIRSAKGNPNKLNEVGNAIVSSLKIN